MIKSKKIYFNVAAIVLLLSVLISSVYAWFYIGDDVHAIKYSIMKIDSTVKTFKAKDTNSNGIPDLLEVAQTAEEKTYYDEKYTFEPVGEEKYAMSEDSSFNLLDEITFENVMPSKVCTLKYCLVNRSSVANRIKFKIRQGPENDALTNVNLLKTLSIKVGYVEHNADKKTQKVTFGEKLYLCDFLNSLNKNNINELDIPMPIINGETDLFIDGMGFTTDGENHGDFWLQIEMEPYAEISQNPNCQLTQDEYNSLQNGTAYLPFIYIYFEVLG